MPAFSEQSFLCIAGHHCRIMLFVDWKEEYRFKQDEISAETKTFRICVSQHQASMNWPPLFSSV